MGAIFEYSLYRHAVDRAKAALPAMLVSKNEKIGAPYHPSPYGPPLQRAYSAPLPGQQPYFFPGQIQNNPYGYGQQQIFYATPAIPQPYYSGPIQNQYSPHGSFNLTPQTTFGGHAFNEQPYIPPPTEPATSSYQPPGEHHPHLHPAQQ
jgi:hypothetical protein